MHLEAGADGEQAVFATPDDQGGLLDGAETAVEQVLAGFHGIHAAPNDAAAAAELPESGAGDEVRHGSGTRREHLHQAMKAGLVGGRE